MGLIMVLIVLVVGVGAAIVIGTAHTPATLLAASAALEGPSQALVVRFIDRSRRFRRAGSVAALLVFVAGWVVFQAEHRGSDLQVNFVLLAGVGLAGSTVGSIAAEAFRVRRPSGPRLASLDVRDPGAFRDRVAERLERLLLGVGVVMVAAAAAAGFALAWAFVWVVALLALIGLRWWGTRAIAFRPRPVLAPTLSEADDLVRRLAVSAGLGRPIGTLQALVTSALCGSLVPNETFDSTGLAQVVSGVAWWLAVVSLFIAAVWWWQNRGFGLRPATPRSVGRTIVYAGLSLAVVVGLLIAFRA